ncbi:NADase-type glycan-binding domain-containing protein [Haliangium sp.]|uniref:NADase-type glycan-binding domain-containing protein n=1 Tax=Haliangium sp. TaxID=2663208 RepID=UPI003D0A003B
MRLLLSLSLTLLLALVPAVAGADVDADARAGASAVERRLHPHPVEASSFLWTDWNRFQENYHPLYAADEDPKTAWTEGDDGSGAGEWLRFHVTEMKQATRVRLSIRAGYQKSKRLFAANARPRQVTIKLLPGGLTSKVTLEDRMGWQEVVVSQPVGPLEAIEMQFDSVYEGTRYTDLCISDVRIFVTATTRENPAYEKSKLQKTLAWKAERLRTSRQFKRKASQELPLLPGYQVTEVGDDSDNSNDLDMWYACKDAGSLTSVCRLRTNLAWVKRDPVMVKRAGAALAVAERVVADPNKLRPVKFVARDKRPVPSVDGVYIPWLEQSVSDEYGDGAVLPVINSLAVFRTDQIGAFEVKREQSLERALGAELPGCDSSSGRIYTWALKENLAERKEVLRALLVVRCGTVEMRDGDSTAAEVQVLVYGDDGRLALVLGPTYASAFTWAIDGETAVIDSGRAVLFEGRVMDLSRPAVASAQ